MSQSETVDRCWECGAPATVLIAATPEGGRRKSFNVCDNHEADIIKWLKEAGWTEILTLSEVIRP